MEKSLKTILPRTILRTEASSTADIVALIPAETELEILTEVDEFLEVSCWLAERGEVTGYVDRVKLGLPPKVDPEIGVHPDCACGVNKWQRVSYRLGGHPYYSIVIPTGILDCIFVQARVCLSCGRYEQYIDPADIEKLKSLS